MTAAGLWTAFACALLVFVQVVLTVMGARLQTGIAIVGVVPMLALLVFAHVRLIAPLAQARKEVLALAGDAAPGLARPLFGRSDEIGQISRSLAALENVQLERERLRAEADALRGRVALHGGAAARERFLAELGSTIAPTVAPDRSDDAALRTIAEAAAMLLQSALDGEQRAAAEAIFSAAQPGGG